MTATATATRVWDKIEDGWRYEEPKSVTQESVTIVPVYGVRTPREIKIDCGTDHTPMTLEGITAQAVRRQFDSP